MTPIYLLDLYLLIIQLFFLPRYFHVSFLSLSAYLWVNISFCFGVWCISYMEYDGYVTLV